MCQKNNCDSCGKHNSNPRIYVDSTNTNPIKDGNSWRTAFIILQPALDRAETNNAPTDIWIAKGTYFPSKVYSPNGVTGGRSGLTKVELSTFNLPNNVFIYGGFKGCERKFCDRDPKVNKTILSGGERYWHVVTLGNDIAQSGVTALLDGLTISNGSAQGPLSNNTIVAQFGFAHIYGGGIYSTYGSNLIINEVELFANKALYSFPPSSIIPDQGIGGGIFSINSNLIATRCKFRSNYAAGQAGALGIYNTYETSPHIAKIIDCKFIENTTLNFGGAVVVEGTLPDGNSHTEITESTFLRNFASEGGAIVVDSLRVLIEKSVFKDNTSSVNAGAVSTTNIVNTIASAINSRPLVTFRTKIKECLFEHNTTFGNLILHDALLGGTSAGIDFPLGGGALVCYMNGLLDVIESKFIDNESQNSDGGAILNGRSAASQVFGIPGLTAFKVETNVTKCEFINNRAINGSGGAIASLPSSFVFTPPIVIPQTATVLNVRNSDFVENCATISGGAIYLNNTVASLKKNCFQDNKAPIGSDIYAVSSNINNLDTSLYIRPAGCGKNTDCRCNHKCKC